MVALVKPATISLPGALSFFLRPLHEIGAAGVPRLVVYNKIDLADPRVYELFVRGDTKGIFQFESGGMRDVVMRMKPNRIEDLIAANALRAAARAAPRSTCRNAPSDAFDSMRASRSRR